ncbi:aspartate/ammonia ligase [Paenibacillus curdlanolyticus YK9]|uniref:Aspartate--ammonia ligase n=1 Tax=Paenibacillus curdlanolyticus YK9 TaxID=717606 RepID=E0IE80_9BACL|nr:aspartate--ammonia ligase [Paenibacillus curdlanolyticus]EFM09434.1 aspartate/ammonia ligase [Paenibacillus curdlanolyticus YK9]
MNPSVSLSEIDFRDSANKLNVKETYSAIHQLKQTFEKELSSALNLTYIEAPLIVFSGTGVNDNLNGSETPVRFTASDIGEQSIEIVHSLAKWKRMALQRSGFSNGEGLFTRMNAIRRDEIVGNHHSIYVDQWDWERVISHEERTLGTLRQTVETIYNAIKNTEKQLNERYACFANKLAETITFVTSQQLEDEYPNLTPKERENEAARQYGAVFVMQIGGLLKSGIRHDGRSPDYDDWSLNGDILVWNPVLKSAFELSSMGIRVDEASLELQLGLAGCSERMELDFHRALMAGELPYTIGGGIGQSRLCMFLLEKAHIGQVQASIWPERIVNEYKGLGITLL